MRRCSPELPGLVYAAIDSMGVVNHKSGVSTDLSPQQTVIEETKVALRRHYVCYEEARRQLEFLEQGGDPLDFRPGNAASHSVQSTSLTDQHPEQFVISEAKGSFALADSPPGDSVESSGRPEAPPTYEPNSADNLMLFDGENSIPKGERSLLRSNRDIIGPSEQSSQLDGSRNAKESGATVAFGLPKKAYRRRNRSRPSRDGGRSSSVDVMLSSSGHNMLPSRHASRELKVLTVDTKVLTADTDNQKDNVVYLNYNLKPTSPDHNIVFKAEPSKIRLDMEIDGGEAIESYIVQTKGDPSNDQTDINAATNMHDNQHNHLLESEAQITNTKIVLSKPASNGESKQASLGGPECDLSSVGAKVEDTCSLTAEISGDKGPLNEIKNKNAVIGTKGLDLGTCGNLTSFQLNGNVDTETYMNLKGVGSNGCMKEGTVASEALNMEGNKSAQEINETKIDDMHAVIGSDNNLLHDHQGNGSLLESEEALNEKVSGSQSEANDPIAIEGKEQVGITSLENEIMPILLDSNPQPGNENTHTEVLNSSVDISVPENQDTEFSTRDSAISPEQQTCSEDLKMKLKVHEDSILEEARIVEAKRKRISELSVHMLRQESRQKCHWDFVLEEMAWLANDFAQERLWKITAAAHIGRQATSAARLKFEEQDIHARQKQVASCLAKAVMDFWCLVEETSKKQELQKPVKDYGHTVQGYALRFLHCNNSPDQFVQSKVATSPDSISSLQNMDMSWKDQLTEENLFYSVPAGAMETYRNSIEAHILQREKTGISIPEEVETSGYVALAEYGSRENAFEEDEGETNTYYLPGAFENSKPSKLLQKKKRHLMKELAARSYEMGSDSPFMQSVENKAGNHHSVLIGKRASNTLNASIPTKRVRTASRQRVPSPFNAGAHGCLQAPSKTDASSGDTNSFQDEQNNVQGGSDVPHNMEVESVRNMDRQLAVDSEVLHKTKKKKKAKNLGSTYEYNWRSDSSFHNEQRDNYKRRPESHHFESNGGSGLYGQHVGKKPKLIKQSMDNSFDNVSPVNCSISSPVASQMSNMSNPTKFIKMLGGRDRGRKTKGLKSASGQPGSGTSWSLFEDQALVVLVHDMGPNWDLVSDAFNSTLKFKCIFRKPKECKERHKVLMDSPAGEGADSADDSGSSQPYRSTLPGIPKGSARQLFQRLQGPMEEDTIKSHLEKIIAVGKKQHHKRAQDPRPLQQPHNSHTYALSQVCPNNLNGGPILTPLDLCDATASSPEVLSLGYQSPQSSGIPNSNQGSITPMLPASGANLSAQAFASAVPGSNFSSASSQISNSVRDVRSGIPRSASLSTDEQQRLQQYSQMVSGRNFQQSNIPVSGVHSGTDRGVRMLSSGNGVGIPSGLHRSIPMPRAGLQGIASSSLVGPGSMLSSGMVAMPNPVNIHSGPGAAQGNSIIRPRDPMHMMRPTQNVENQRQMMIPELQMQVALGNSQGIPPFGGLSSSFSNQTTPPSVPSYPLHHQQLHPMSTQQPHMLTNSHHPHLQGPNLASNTPHQAYAIRVAKEKQIQQRVLQQQQQFAPSNALLPHVPGQPQQVSSPQNGSPSQSTPPQVPLSPLAVSSSMSSMSSNPKKHHIPPHIVVRNPQVGGNGSINQAGKQRQRQPQQQQVQQSGRHHPQQRHQSQSQHQAKIIKGVGRGNLMHENLLTDNTLPNGPSTTPGSQIAEKGGENVHIIQGEELFSGSGFSSVQPQKQSAPSHFPHQPQAQQNLYSSQATSSKQHQQTRAHSENGNQNHVSSVQAGPVSDSSQAVPPNQQQHKLSQPHSKIVNQTQSAVQMLLQQNRQVNYDHANKHQAREVHASLEPASAALWKASDHVSDSCSSNPVTPIGSAGSPPLTNPPIELLNPVPQGIEKIQSLGSLTHVRHDGDVQWSEEPSLLPLPPPLEQKPEELKQQSEEQSLLLQGGGSSL